MSTVAITATKIQESSVAQYTMHYRKLLSEFNPIFLLLRKN
jgi:hypothetical protein